MRPMPSRTLVNVCAPLRTGTASAAVVAAAATPKHSARFATSGLLREVRDDLTREQFERSPCVFEGEIVEDRLYRRELELSRGANVVPHLLDDFPRRTDPRGAVRDRAVERRLLEASEQLVVTGVVLRTQTARPVPAGRR